MKNKNSSAPIAVIGIIVIAFTIAAFFLLDIERIAIFLWALGFLLLSEIILFVGLICVRKESAKQANVFMRSGVTSVLLLYVVATVVVTLLAGSFADNLNVFILIELGVIAIFTIVTIAILAFSRSIARRNAEDASKVDVDQPKRGGF